MITLLPVTKQYHSIKTIGTKTSYVPRCAALSSTEERGTSSYVLLFHQDSVPQETLQESLVLLCYGLALFSAITKRFRFQTILLHLMVENIPA